MRFWAKYKNSTGKVFVDERSFDPKTMDKLDSEEDKKLRVIGTANLQEMIQTKTACAISSGRGSNDGDSMFYNGQLDEGATSEFLDKHLDIAKDRAVERNAKQGSSFRKIVNLRRRKNK